jgi:hypothetical protein
MTLDNVKEKAKVLTNTILQHIGIASWLVMPFTFFIHYFKYLPNDISIYNLINSFGLPATIAMYAAWVVANLYMFKPEIETYYRIGALLIALIAVPLVAGLLNYTILVAFTNSVFWLGNWNISLNAYLISEYGRWFDGSIDNLQLATMLFITITFIALYAKNITDLFCEVSKNCNIPKKKVIRINFNFLPKFKSKPAKSKPTIAENKSAIVPITNVIPVKAVEPKVVEPKVVEPVFKPTPVKVAEVVKPARPPEVIKLIKPAILAEDKPIVDIGCEVARTRYLEFKQDILDAVDNYETNLGSAKPKFFLGYGSNVEHADIPLFWTPSDTPHLFLAGGTGSGKTSLLHSVLISMNAYNRENIGWNILEIKQTLPKLYFKNKASLPNVDKNEDWVDIVISTIKMYRKRISNLQAIGADFNITNDTEFEMYKQLYLQTKDPAYKRFSIYRRFILVLDELPAILAEISRVKGNEAVQGVLNDLTYIGNLGRSFGVHMLISSNTWTSSNLPANISPILTNSGLLFIGEKGSATMKGDIVVPSRQRKMEFVTNFPISTCGIKQGKLALIDFKDGVSNYQNYLDLKNTIEKRI